MAKADEAYDFDRFTRTPKQVTQRIIQPPELKVVKSRESHGDSFWVYAALMFVSVLIIVAAVIYNNMVLTELTAEIEKVQGEYAGLQDDYKRMQVELEGKISLRTIEEAATTRLGMSKAESYQVEYVNLGSESRVLLSRQITPSPSDRIKELCDPLLEYLK